MPTNKAQGTPTPPLLDGAAHWRSDATWGAWWGMRLEPGVVAVVAPERRVVLERRVMRLSDVWRAWWVGYGYLVVVVGALGWIVAAVSVALFVR